MLSGPVISPLEVNRQLWLRLAVIPATLLAIAALATRASERYLLLAVGGAVAVVFYRWPLLGLLALVAAGPFVPFALGTGTQTGLNVTVLLLALLAGLWLAEMALKKDFRLPSSRTVRPLLALSLVTLLATAAGNQPWLVFARTAPLRAQVGGVAIFLLSAAAFLLVAHRVRNLRSLQVLTWLYLAIGAVYIVGRLLPPLGRIVLPLFQQGSTGSLFWAWVVALSLGQALFNRHLHPRWRIALAGLALATLYVGMTQGLSWSSGWMPALVAALAVAWLAYPRLALPATIAGGVFVGLNHQVLTAAVMIGDQEYSLMTRAEAWRILIDVVKLNPLLGLGPANYYWYTSLFPILGYYVPFNSHNNYMDIVAQVGILGLACFAWFIYEVGRLGLDLWARVPVGFPRAYVVGSMGGLVGTLFAAAFGDWMLPFVYNIGLVGMRSSIAAWLFLGGLVSLNALVPTAASPGVSRAT